MNGKPWTPAEAAEVRRLDAAGKCAHEIAAVLNRSRQAVQFKAREMGLVLRRASRLDTGTDRPICRHCRRPDRPARKRGICYHCGKDPAILALYPKGKSGAKKKAEPEPTAAELDLMIAQQLANLPDWWPTIAPEPEPVPATPVVRVRVTSPGVLCCRS